MPTVDNIGLIYLNITIEDGKEAVKAKVTKKVENSKLPGPLKKVAAKHAAGAASDLATPEVMAKMMGQKFCTKLPQKMLEKGLTVQLEEVFRQGNYVVLELQVTNVDSVAIADNLTEVEQESKFQIFLQWFYELLGGKFQRKIENDILPKIVMKGLASEMAKMLDKKMESKGIKAEIEVLKEELQARYFFEKMKQHRDDRQATKEKNPAYRFKKKLMPSMSMEGSSSDEEEEEVWQDEANPDSTDKKKQ